MPTLKRLGSFGLVPDPAELAHDPMRFMDPGDDDGVPRDPVAGVPYRPGLGKNTGQAIVDGVSAQGKWRILSRLVPALEGFAPRDEPHARVCARPPRGSSTGCTARQVAA
ncbi:hypothetical protein G3I61_20430 [Streptomyces diastaticus]|nr:hypothetical protein [Streptomyces diastaticus]